MLKQKRFETLRREIKDDVRKQHDLYVNNLVGDVKANPRDFSRYINSQKKTIKVFRPLKEEEELVSQLQKLNRLRNLMVSLRMCSTKVIIARSHFSVGRAPFMDDIVVSNEGVTKLLIGLNPRP